MRLPVQLKREIGKLWDDISKAPYKEIFNGSVPGLHVWRCVQIQRSIDKAIETYVKRTPTLDDYGLITHGNRLIAALVFETLPVVRFREPSLDVQSIASAELLTALVDVRVKALKCSPEFTLSEFNHSNSFQKPE